MRAYFLPRPLIESLEPRQLLSTYYINASSGSDSHSGLSTSAAWKTLNRANQQTFHAGDKILLQGGQTFNGYLYFPSTRVGTSSSPITVSTYGSGRATINSGTNIAINIAQTSGYSISNLNLRGAGTSTNHTSGIYVHIDWTYKTMTAGLNVSNVDASGYGQYGMQIQVGGTGSTFSNVRVSYSSFHDNKWGGFKITGSAQHSNKNYVIDHVSAYNNYGDTGRSDVTGNGIYLADVDGGLINRCVAHDNGKYGAAPVGIWAAGSNRVTIQYCESYNNHTRSISDGGGFDFDWDTTNSVMQYNYSHSNDGPGFLLGAGTHTNSGNVIRYNVTQNDGRRNGRGGLQIWGNVTNASFYNNVSYITYGTSNTAALYAHDSGCNGLEPKNVQIRNNVFYATSGAKVLNLASGVAARGTLYFSGNAYYSGSGSFKIAWGSMTYTSLINWRNAKGQEKLNGVATGYQGDPKLLAAGAGPTFGNADRLSGLSAYKLQSSSPLINHGVTQPTFLSASTTDFFGDSLPRSGKYDIGVDEAG